MCWLLLCAKEEIRDLLAKDQTKRLELKERPDTGVYVKVCYICFLITLLIAHSAYCRKWERSNC